METSLSSLLILPLLRYSQFLITLAVKILPVKLQYASNITLYYAFLSQNWTVHGFYWGIYEKSQPGFVTDTLKELVALMASGQFTVHISHTFSLAEVSKKISYFLPVIKLFVVLIVYVWL